MRLSLLLAAALCTAATAAAQPTRPEPVAVKVYTTNHYRTVGGIYGTANVYAGSTREWQGFVGGRRVSEVEFYRHAQAHDFADKVARKRGRRNRVTYLGLGLIGSAVALGFYNSETGGGSINDNDDNTLANVAFGMAMVGIGVTARGLTISRGNVSSSRQAVQAARQFNEHYGYIEE